MISPWIIYLCHLADGVKCITLVVGVLTGLFWFIQYFLHTLDGECKMTPDLKLLIAAVISFFIAVIVPSQKTCIEMLVVSTITPETVSMGREAILDSIREIVEIISAK